MIGNFIRARGVGVKDGRDFEHIGTVEKILVEPLQKVLDQGMIPIFLTYKIAADYDFYLRAGYDNSLPTSSSNSAQTLMEQGNRSERIVSHFWVKLTLF